MKECPVCRRTIGSRKSECPRCRTPIRSIIVSNQGNFSKRLTALVPGFGHLWLGHIYKGSVALFGSFLSLVVLGIGSQEFNRILSRLSYWILFWVPWVFLWLQNVKSIRRRFVNYEEISTFFLFFLIIANLFAFFMNVFIVSSYLSI
jgi:hypothetical protein